MSRKLSRTDHRKVRAIQQQYGVGFQQAVNIFREDNPENRSRLTAALIALGGMPARMAAALRLMNDTQLLQLLQRELFAPDYDYAFDGDFAPLDFLDSDLDEVRTSIRAIHKLGEVQDIEKIADPELDLPERASFDFVLEVEAEGEVYWQANAPTPYDAEVFGVIDEDGNIRPVVGDEPAVPLLLTVAARWNALGEFWEQFEVLTVALAEDELKTRQARNSRQEIERMQELGLLPSDEELDAQVEAYEAEQAEREKAGDQPQENPFLRTPRRSR